MDIKEKRKLDLFHFVVDFSFGSLWHIKESFLGKNNSRLSSQKKVASGTLHL